MTWTLLTIAGAFAGFANPVFHFPAAVLLLPAGVLVLGMSSTTPGQAFRRCWLAGGLAYAACLYWTALPLHNHAAISLPLAAAAALLLSFYVGLYAGVFGAIARRILHRLPWFWAGLCGGLAWALLEMLRGVLFSGFPWAVLPSAFVPWPEMLQGLALGGVWAVSGLLAAAACWLALPAARPGAVAGPLTAGSLLLMALFGYGGWALQQPPPPSSGAAVVAMVQGNVDQTVKWEESFQKKTIQLYADLTRKALQNGPADLVVWPETALPFYLQDISDLSLEVRSFVVETQTPLLTGAPAYTMVEPPDSFDIYNSAMLLKPNGQTHSVYDKEHLVPFGEYMPFGEYLPFAKKLTHGTQDFTPGKRTGPLVRMNLALGVLICYETIFPELTQKRVEEGANLFVNISNDAWFGRTSAPLQHLHLSALRAVEQGRTLARATNTGISAVVDSRGRIYKRTGVYEQAVVRVDAPLHTHKTLFHRWSAIVHWAMILVFAVLGVWGLAKPGQKDDVVKPRKKPIFRKK